MNRQLSKSMALDHIEVPSLDGNYGAQVKEQFQNIENNFRKISERDYFKGEKGDSVNTVELDLTDPLNSQWTSMLKSAIQSNYQDKELSPIEEESKIIKWDDNFINNPGKLILMYIGNKVASSMAYVYLDPRFRTDLSKTSVENDYSYLVDVSSVLYYDADLNGFKMVKSFPTIYFDDDQQEFCWEIWGEKSGLPVSGCKIQNPQHICYDVIKTDVKIIKI